MTRRLRLAGPWNSALFLRALVSSGSSPNGRCQHGKYTCDRKKEESLNGVIHIIARS
ncbi:hypothetical protein LZ32DRAFT_600497 [Colletotrichum eremochloae]|nr:hypothetical protein LZ32DRAFT_600497 [Colletotrichum eremochloae]